MEFQNLVVLLLSEEFELGDKVHIDQPNIGSWEIAGILVLHNQTQLALSYFFNFWNIYYIHNLINQVPMNICYIYSSQDSILIFVVEKFNLQLVAEKKIKGKVESLKVCNGKLLTHINKKFSLYKWMLREYDT